MNPRIHIILASLSILGVIWGLPFAVTFLPSWQHWAALPLVGTGLLWGLVSLGWLGVSLENAGILDAE